MKIRVVLADDHKVIREGLRAILASQSDIDVVGVANDGREAIQSVKELKPNVIVLDINMPVLNGIEATRYIREIDPDVQVVILSMHSNKEHVFQALKVGARSYLIKETSALEVADAIRAVHTGRRYLSETIAEAVIDDYVEYRQRAVEFSPLERLSEREREVMYLVVEGRTSAEIAAMLHLSVSTVNTYRSRLMKKIGVEDVPGLVKFAVEHELVSLR